MSKVLVVGGGAAGMFAAVFAARNCNEVHLFEKNEKLGKKLFITGKGRCNLTNACDNDKFFSSVLTNQSFMYSSYSRYTSGDVMEFFRRAGVETKVERGGRVFPVSDRSSDVIAGLTRELKKLGVHVHLHAKVTQIEGKDRFLSIRLMDGTQIDGDKCIVATGGLSYKATGSDGDGYRFAKDMGHRVTRLLPSLVPLAIKEDYPQKMQGLSLRNVQVTILDKDKRVYEGFGEMLFTHYGVSGPLILSASGILADTLSRKELKLVIDLKPALNDKALDLRIIRDFNENANKQLRHSLGKLLPAKMIPVILEQSGIDPDKKVNQVNRQERKALSGTIKNFTLTITGLRGFDEAVITKGGVDVRQVNPATMESKIVKGLYFAGEVLDLDALTGGFNLQIAWSTAHAAGSAIY